MNADGVQAQGDPKLKKDAEKRKPKEVLNPQPAIITVSPEAASSGGIGSLNGDGKEECSVCFEEEGIAAKIQKVQEMPNAIEVEAHNTAGHVPYRSRCPHCIKGKGVASRHLKCDSTKDEVATISMDYFYFIKAEKGEDRGPPSVAIVDNKSGVLKSAVLKTEGC